MKKVSNLALHIGARVGDVVQTNFSAKDFEMYHEKGKGVTFPAAKKTKNMEHFIPEGCIAVVRYETALPEQPEASIKQATAAQTSGDELKVDKRTKAYRQAA